MFRMTRFLFIPAVILSACRFLGNQPEEEVIALAYDKYLYRSELAGVVPDGISAADSLEITRQYIDNWVRQQVLLHHAQGNLPKDKMDFEKQLENYRNSLIIYEYESELIRQKLDTVVSEEEIRAFYNENESNFQLRENIVRVSYVKIPRGYENSPQAKKAKQYLMSSKSGDMEKLIELCDKSTISCRPDDENWIVFNDLMRELPLEIYDQENFLKNRSFHETGDSLFVYLIRFNDYKIMESTSPLSLEVDRIRNMILNMRKQKLINRMQEEVFQEALKNKEFEIF